MIRAFIDSCYNLWIALWLKDPCRNCVVKACCSDKCEVVVEIDKFLFPHETIQEKKILAAVTGVSVLCAVVSFGILLKRSVLG